MDKTITLIWCLFAIATAISQDNSADEETSNCEVFPFGTSYIEIDNVPGFTSGDQELHGLVPYGTMYHLSACFQCECSRVPFPGNCHNAESLSYPDPDDPCIRQACVGDKLKSRDFRSVCNCTDDEVTVVRPYPDCCACQIDPCNPNPCMNNGLCYPRPGNTFSCRCRCRFTGRVCETKKNPCNSNPCLNGGSCVQDSGFTYTCNCLVGYTGSRCETKTCAIRSDMLEGEVFPYIEDDDVMGYTSGDIGLKTGERVNVGKTVNFGECNPCKCIDQDTFTCSPISHPWTNANATYDCMNGYVPSTECLPTNVSWSRPNGDECYRSTCVNGSRVDFDMTEYCKCGYHGLVVKGDWPSCCACLYV